MRTLATPPILLLAFALAACGGDSGGEDGAINVDADASTDAQADVPNDVDNDLSDNPDSGATDTAEPIFFGDVTVTVTLDGAPVEGAIVLQGGSQTHYETGADGTVVVSIDNNIMGVVAVIASHPEARILATRLIAENVDAATIALTRYDVSDNPDYEFQDPGEPRDRETTAQCSHCHQTIGDAWFGSQHRTAASNPRVHDLFAGAAHTAEEEADCTELGGAWLPGLQPGTGEEIMRCYVGDGALQALNPTCETDNCDTAPEPGECANCHAPATTDTDGTLGGHSLLDARGHAYDYGVFCDVCHRVDRVAPLDAPAGAGGRLVFTRPSEEPTSLALGAWAPLTFGPSHSVPNPRMGSVQRNHYRDASLCSGCHEHNATPPPNTTLDLDRWPTGELPSQNTYTEWRDGVLGDAMVCNDCHMPPDADVLNGADLQRFLLSDTGPQGGWIREPGSVRRHSWLGPRSENSNMLELAAALFVEHTTLEGVTTANVTVKNVGAGHAIPTGEPSRQMILLVKALCGDLAQPAVGGHTVPDYGGELGRQPWGGATLWPNAQSGDSLRVLRTPGEWHDYPGWGPFGDGTFNDAEKGMPIELWVAELGITAVGETGALTLDDELPAGDVLILVRNSEEEFAGSPGFAFARIMTDADGRRAVPHFVANDIASDNRLLPQESYTTTHVFNAACDDPVIHAQLLYRPYPLSLSRERGWPIEDRVMTQVRR